MKTTEGPEIVSGVGVQVHYLSLCCPVGSHQPHVVTVEPSECGKYN